MFHRQHCIGYLLTLNPVTDPLGMPLLGNNLRLPSVDLLWVLLPLSNSWVNTIIVNASARPPRLSGLPNVGTCNYRYTGI